VSVPNDMDCFMSSKLQKTFQRNMNGSHCLSGQDDSVKTRIEFILYSPSFCWPRLPRSYPRV